MFKFNYIIQLTLKVYKPVKTIYEQVKVYFFNDHW